MNICRRRPLTRIDWKRIEFYVIRTPVIISAFARVSFHSLAHTVLINCSAWYKRGQLGPGGHIGIPAGG